MGVAHPASSTATSPSCPMIRHQRDHSLVRLLLAAHQPIGSTRRAIEERAGSSVGVWRSPTHSSMPTRQDGSRKPRSQPPESRPDELSNRMQEAQPKARPRARPWAGVFLLQLPAACVPLKADSPLTPNLRRCSPWGHTERGLRCAVQRSAHRGGRVELVVCICGCRASAPWMAARLSTAGAWRLYRPGTDLSTLWRTSFPRRQRLGGDERLLRVFALCPRL